MTELELIIDLHKDSDRQGPGSERDTIRALKLTGLQNQNRLKIADIGCGTGGQTLTLAQYLEGHITAVDLFPDFLDQLTKRSAKIGLQNKISIVACSMEYLPFQQSEFDLIWSEGAIYNMGFEQGIKQWKNYLKVGGYLAVSEVTWISQSRPTEIEEFWTNEYPEIGMASDKIQQLENNGYTLAGYFYLNQESWLEHYYKPIEASFDLYLERHGHSELAGSVVNSYKAEIEMYQKFKDHFSYGFYIAKRSD